MQAQKIPSSQINRGYSIALVSVLLLSTTPVIIRYLGEAYQLPTLILALWRDVFMAITLISAFTIFNKKLFRVTKHQLLFLMIYGVVVALFNTFWTLSVDYNGAAVATVLVYSSAAFTVLLGWWLLKESLTWVKLVAVVLSLSGCLLVAGVYNPEIWRSNLSGILVGILSGLAYAGYSLMGRSAANRGISPWTTLLYSFGFAGIYLLIFNLIPGDFFPGKAVTGNEIFWLGERWLGWLILFLLAAVPTLGGFGFYNVSLSYLPSSIANLIVTLEPAFTAIMAYLFLAERLTLIQITGGLITISAVAFLRLFENKA
jgi:drug/metabolite transporter (DMT)-like permease